MSALPWPPGNREVLIAWQQQVGTDLQIATRLGISRATVYGQRKRHGVPPLPRKKQASREEPMPACVMSDAAVAALFRARRFEDVRSCGGRT